MQVLATMRPARRLLLRLRKRTTGRIKGGVMIDRIDHIVLTVRSLEATLSFYERVLGFRREVRADAPASLRFGRQKN